MVFFQWKRHILHHSLSRSDNCGKLIQCNVASFFVQTNCRDLHLSMFSFLHVPALLGHQLRGPRWTHCIQIITLHAQIEVLFYCCDNLGVVHTTCIFYRKNDVGDRTTYLHLFPVTEQVPYLHIILSNIVVTFSSRLSCISFSCIVIDVLTIVIIMTLRCMASPNISPCNSIPTERYELSLRVLKFASSRSVSPQHTILFPSYRTNIFILR